ncbi:MAG: hypothetical protein WAR39_01065 [Prevotella sp.]
MKYFTPEELKPAEATLNFIRQFAHTYRVVILKDRKSTCCLN